VLAAQTHARIRSSPGADTAARFNVNEHDCLPAAPNRKAVRLLGSSMMEAGGEPCGQHSGETLQTAADAAKSSAKFARGPGSNEELGEPKRSPAPRIK